MNVSKDNWDIREIDFEKFNALKKNTFTIGSAFNYPKQYFLLSEHHNTQSNLARMAKGLAPQVSLNGKMYSMELHHINPRRLGGSNSYDNLLKVTPWKHADIDPFRHFVP